MAGKMRRFSLQRAGLVFLRAGKLRSSSFLRAGVLFISILWYIQVDLVLARTTRIFSHGRLLTWMFLMDGWLRSSSSLWLEIVFFYDIHLDIVLFLQHVDAGLLARKNHSQLKLKREDEILANKWEDKTLAYKRKDEIVTNQWEDLALTNSWGGQINVPT